MSKSNRVFIQDCKKAIFRLTPKELTFIFSNTKHKNSLDNYDLYTEAVAEIERVRQEKPRKSMLQSDMFFFIRKLNKLLYKYEKDHDNHNRINLILVSLIEDIANCSNAGCAYLAQGEDEKALYFTQKAMQLLRETNAVEEDDWKTLNNYIYCLNALNKSEKMIDELETEIFQWELEEIKISKKIKEDPESLDSLLACDKWMDITQYLITCYVWMGTAYGHVYQPKKAMLYFDKAKEYEYMKFNNELLYNALANHYIDTCEYSKAKEYALKAIKIDPKNSEAYSNYGLACTFAGDKDEAKKFLVKAYKNAPGDNGIKHNLLLCMTETGDLPLPTPCPDENSYIDELISNGECDKYLKRIVSNE